MQTRRLVAPARRLASLTLAAALLAVAPAAAPARQPAPEPKAERPRVEMVFAIDTTGSMGGLIEGAKKKVWSIVNEVVKGKPTPDIRLGLVAYRDKGDAYVTQVTQLSSDLDAVYKDLMAFQAGGGGDGPENVNQALHDALKKIEWSGKDVRAFRVIFLVGDAPPHTDYQDVPGYEETVREAAQRGVVVNAVRCGQWAEAGTHFAQIAKLGGGEFLTIDQTGGMLAVATPHDAKLAELSRRLDATYLVAGGEDKRKAAKLALDDGEATASKGGATAAADRAVFRAAAPASAPRAVADADLVGLLETGAADEVLSQTASLPAEMQAMSEKERKAYVERKAEERRQVQAEMAEVAAKRDAFLKERAAEGPKDAFDTKVVDIVERQAEAAAGIAY